MAIYLFFGLSKRIFEVIVISVVKTFVAWLLYEMLKVNETSRLPYFFIIRSISITSQQGRLHKTYCQLLKSQRNFLEHEKTLCIQIQVDFIINHVC